MSNDASPIPTSGKARAPAGAPSLVHVRLVLESSGRELACVPLTRLPVAGDRIQLQQVILNLLLNASDAIGAANDGPRQVSIETGRAPPRGG